jgi:hypothetical protein
VSHRPGRSSADDAFTLAASHDGAELRSVARSLESWDRFFSSRTMESGVHKRQPLIGHSSDALVVSAQRKIRQNL